MLQECKGVPWESSAPRSLLCLRDERRKRAGYGGAAERKETSMVKEKNRLGNQSLVIVYQRNSSLWIRPGNANRPMSLPPPGDHLGHLFGDLNSDVFDLLQDHFHRLKVAWCVHGLRLCSRAAFSRLGSFPQLHPGNSLGWVLTS